MKIASTLLILCTSSLAFAAGINPTDEPESKRRRTENIAFDFDYEPAVEGDLNEVLRLVEEGEPSFITPNLEGRTALHYAAQDFLMFGGDTEIIEYLVTRAEFHVSDMEVRSPLHDTIEGFEWYTNDESVRLRALELVRILATVRAFRLGDNNGNTPLHLAAAHGYLDVVQILLEHFPRGLNFPRAANFRGWTAEGLAQLNGHEEVRELIENVDRAPNWAPSDHHLYPPANHQDIRTWMLLARRIQLFRNLGLLVAAYLAAPGLPPSNS